MGAIIWLIHLLGPLIFLTTEPEVGCVFFCYLCGSNGVLVYSFSWSCEVWITENLLNDILSFDKKKWYFVSAGLERPRIKEVETCTEWWFLCSIWVTFPAKVVVHSQFKWKGTDIVQVSLPPSLALHTLIYYLMFVIDRYMLENKIIFDNILEYLI